MTNDPIRSIAIVGGGTAGWMSAAALSKYLGKAARIHLIESEQIGTIGVGEATIPPIIGFIRSLGIDEDDLIRKTKATFKLAIEFKDWLRIGHTYYHPFGQTGFDMNGVPFFACWLRLFQQGRARKLDDYSLMSVAASGAKFMRPIQAPTTPLEGITYALHFDASLFARTLREYCEARGVVRTEGKVANVALRGEDGFIERLDLEDGTTVTADLFIDCTGLRGLLIEGALGAGYDDWTHWLPCNRAVAVGCERKGPLSSHTLSAALDAGWRWRIPLQHRVGNGYVYAADLISDDRATDTLLAQLEGKPASDPLLIKFTAGRRKRMWIKNCVALGLAAGFLEPLESTSIHLIQRGIALLISTFPDRRFAPEEIARYNKVSAFEYERIRDFLIAHYVLTEREDSELWRHCRALELPDSLKERIALYRAYGRIVREAEELFVPHSWQHVFVGQDLMPGGYDPIADMIPEAQIAANLADLADKIQKSADYMPRQTEYIERNCSAMTTSWR